MTFPEFLASHGIIPPERGLVMDKWVRCDTDAKPKGKTAAAKLMFDGAFGLAMDFATMTETATWRSGSKSTKKRDFAAENAERSERLALKAKEEVEGTRRALRRWNDAQPIVGAAHPYLESKRATMRGCAGLRVDVTGALLIPMWRDGKIVSLQSISPIEDGKFEKKYSFGPSSKLCHFWIEREKAPVTVLCEGYATGVTLFESMPSASVLVCFSASNLIAIAERHDFTGLCIIAGDNDHRQPCPWCLKNGEHLQNPPTQPRPDECGCNPGWTAAVKAAKAIGCGWAIPPSIEGVSDWNDVFCGLLAAKEKAAEGEYDNSPMRLRAAALAPIGSALMRAAKMVKNK